MKKLFCLILFAFPFLIHAQHGSKNCHTDLVFGFDIGDGFYISSAARPQDTPPPEDKLIFGFRLGTNLNFPITDRVQLVTGFRISDRVVRTHNTTLIQHEAFTEKILHDLYMEVPFRARYVFGFSKKKSQLYLEGGLDVNIYAASFVKDSIEEAFGREENYSPFSLSVNLAPGFEIQSNNKDLSYFIQPILRLQVTQKTEYSKIRFYHVGIETGIRF